MTPNAATLSQLVNAFEGVSVLVVGEAMLDSYLHGGAARLSREAPVPIVTLSGRSDAPGGAANTAANLRSLGARPALLSVIGDDPEGARLLAALDARVTPADQLIVHPTRLTLAKHRVLADGQMLVRFDQGSTQPIDPGTERMLIDRLSALFVESDAVVVSDYGYGILTPRVVQAIADLQRANPRLLVVDAKHLMAYRHVGVSAVKPNYDEALQLLATRPLNGGTSRADRIEAHGDFILEMTGAHLAAVTLDTEGAIVFERGRPPYRTYARPARHNRAAGAGDTFVSVLALALAVGAHSPAAAELASAAAAVVVGKEGTAACSAVELLEYLSPESKLIASAARLASRVEFYRHQGQRVVFTNGCFDILHSGHITYLNRAKALGDVLIVGLNGDASVRRLKGATRPINPFEDRAQVLAGLSSVDHIVAFDEDTPHELIRVVRPDVYVKGGDYTREMLPEASLVERLGGTVHLLPYVEDRSTSRIIERVRRWQRRADAA